MAVAFSVPALLQCNRSLSYSKHFISATYQSGEEKKRTRTGVPTPRRALIVRTRDSPAFRLPLAAKLDYLLNHPIAELLVSGLVVASCLVFALETVDLGSDFLNALPNTVENGIGALFSAEYFLRWYGRSLSPRFLLTRAMIIDFCAIVPLFVDLAGRSSNSVFVRILRLTRIFRLQRVMEDEWRDLFGDMSPPQIRIANVALTVFSILYVSAGLFYDAEVTVNPEVLSFFDAFYFATITLFTVGFGDVTPLTSTGRVGSCINTTTISNDVRH